MRLLVKFERLVESMMSLVSLAGFFSTLYLLFVFLTTPPEIVITQSGVGVQGIYQYTIKNITIQGVPFFWVFTSLVSLSAGAPRALLLAGEFEAADKLGVIYIESKSKSHPAHR